MFKTLKYWQMGSALKAKGNAQEAYSAVLELGRAGDNKAVALLVETLARKDGVARSAARELGKLRRPATIAPLIAMLDCAEVNQAAAEALLGFGAEAVGPLIAVLTGGSGTARQLAASALGELRDKRAVEPLVRIMETDEVYAVRTAAATALGNLKDARAIWVLVATLQMRDETDPARQAALDQLRTAAHLAMRKIGDPLAVKQGPKTVTDLAAEALADVEKRLVEAGVHPRLTGDIKLLNQEELLGVLRELIAASEELSWAKLENREPMVADAFKTYEQRAGVATSIGRELYRRGGRALLQQMLEQQLSNHSAIANWWGDIGG